ncbi:MAG: outer membrane lipoprotein carrier protein LolA [Blastocatellia bacterium]
MKILSIILTLLTLSVFAPLLVEAKEDPAAVAAKIQSAYDKINDLQADFVQSVRFEDFDTPYLSKGKFFLKKGKMRWDYHEPSRQQIVVEGERLLFYIPEHKQLVKSRVGGESDSHLPLQLLSGTSRLDQDFQISIEEEPRSDQSLSLRLIPKNKQTPLTKVVASVAPSPQVEGLIIQKVILFETNGNVSTFSFEGMQINKGFSEEIFSLKYPKGTEVIESP